MFVLFPYLGCGRPHPAELSRPRQMRMSHPGHILLLRWERRWRFPLVENAPNPSPKWLLLGLLWEGVYSMYANLINQCLKSIVTENRYYL